MLGISTRSNKPTRIGQQTRIWHLVVGAVLIAITAAKAIGLGDGLTLLEPDEVGYSAIAKSFHQGWFPAYLGRDYYSQQPLFMFVSYLFTFLFPQSQMAVKVVSLLSSLALSAMVYWYGCRVFSPMVGFVGALVLMLMPLSMFYSRRGLIDFFLTCLVFAFFVSLREALKTQSSNVARLAGVFLASIVLSKLHFFVLFTIPVFYHLKGVGSNLRQRDTLYTTLRSELLSLRSIPATTLVTAVVVLVLVWIPGFLRNPLKFGYNIYNETLGFLTTRREATAAAEMPLVGLAKHFVYFVGNLDDWLGWPIMLLAVAGIVLLIAQRKLDRLDVIPYFAVLFIFMLIPTPYPRYLVALLPLMALLAAVGCCDGAMVVAKTLSIGKLGTIVQAGLALLVVAVVLPSTWLAYGAGNENLVAEMDRHLSIMPRLEKQTTWLFSQYWPVVLYYESGYRSTWLTDDLKDAQAWSGLYPIEENPMDILESDGGIVVLENMNSRLLGNLESRQAPLRYLRERFSPDLTLQTKFPVFPYSTKEVSKLEVYVIRPGEWQYKYERESG